MDTRILPMSTATQNAELREQKMMPKQSFPNTANAPSVAAVPCAERKPLVPICDTPVGLQEGILAPGTAVRHPLQASPALVKPEPGQDDPHDLPDLVSHEQISDAMVENFDLRPTERRGARDRKQRVMMIDGQPVLKINNYDLENGEPSVFDRELNKEALSLADVKQEVRPVQKDPKKPRKQAQSARPAHVDNPMQAQNRQMKAEREEYRARRALCMSQHQKVIKPFMSEKAFIGLKARAAAAEKFVHPALPEGQPASIKAEMRDYQLESLRWSTSMYDNGVSCILADEMGLGKTLQAIAFIANLLLDRGTKGPALVVAPLSVLSSWMLELSKWCPALRAVKLHTCSPGEVQRLKKQVFTDPDSFHVAVTTYEMVHSRDMAPLIKSVDWRVLVLDEGHRIKNEETLLAGALRNVRHQFCLLLTGTPLQNNLHEFYALLSFLLPDTFNDSTPFDSAFDLAANKVDNQQLDFAHHLSKLLILRRTKATVNMVLPPKVETRINCPMSEMQLFWYKRLLLKNSPMMLKNLGASSDVKHDEESSDWKKMQMLLVQLRKCINHPYNFPGAEPEFDGSTGEDVVAASGKMMVLDQLLTKLKAKGHRVVLFSQFNIMLDIIEDCLNMRGYKYRRLDGSTNRVQRRIDISLFNRPGSDIFIYILNTRAGGLGINLQTADTCILYDSDWNPQVDVQAMARVHRIGQTKTVHIYRLFTKETVEERILLRADKKLYLDKMVNRDCEDGEAGQGLEKLGMSEILNILKFGADRIFQGQAGTIPTSDELDAIIDRSGAPRPDAESGPAASGPACLEDAKMTTAEFAADGLQQESISCNIFNGEDYGKYKNSSMKELAEEWHSKRERKSTCVVIDGYVVSRSSIKDQEKLEAWAAAGKTKKNKRNIYENSIYCQHCWDGGELFMCDSCPASYHASCLGFTSEEMHRMQHFKCPHHSCVGCDRKAQSAGGMLMACEGCSNSYCEDCLPHDADVVDTSEHFERLGFNKPSTVCYIRCNSHCQEWCSRDEFIKLGTHREPEHHEPEQPGPKKSATQWWNQPSAHWWKK